LFAQRQASTILFVRSRTMPTYPAASGFWDPCTVVETDWKREATYGSPLTKPMEFIPNSAGHPPAARTIPPELVENHPNPVPTQ